MVTAGPAARHDSISRHPHRLGAHAGALFAFSCVAIALFGKVGEDVLDQETTPFDSPVRAWMLAHQLPWLRGIFLAITRIGSPTVAIPLTILLAAWLWSRRGMPIAGAVVLGPAVATATMLLLKHGYARQRPAGGVLLHELTYSFPSGHATAAAAIFPTLAYVFWREELLDGNIAALIGVLAPLAIGISRVYLDVHWATDVLGGWAIGAFVAALGAVIYERVRRLTRERGEVAHDTAAVPG